MHPHRLPPIAFAALALLGSGCAGAPPTTLGLPQGQLAPCPGSPNCVSSLEGEDDAHRVAPLIYTGPREEAMARVAEIVGQMDGARVVTRRAEYLHAEFTTPMMGFVDDVEFHAPAEAQLIHVRSASRVGYSDLGVNRERVEQLRAAWEAR